MKFLLLVISFLLIFTIGMILPQEGIALTESKMNINNGVYTNDVQVLTQTDVSSSTSKLYFSPGVWSENDASFAIRVFNSDSEQEMIWHYNIYKVKNDESPSYLNMIGQVSEMCFEYTISSNEEFYYVIQPESNEGVYGRAIKIKISLQS